MKLPLADIGEESERGVVSALNDLFGPAFREVGEYLADKVRFHRTVALAKILRRAKVLSDQEGLSNTPPDLKFLVPFTEKASLEHDDTLIELWARLFVGSLKSKEAHLIFFQDVLSRIGAREAMLFEQIAFYPEVKRGSIRQIEDVELTFTRDGLVRSLLYLSEINTSEEDLLYHIMCMDGQFGVRFIGANWCSDGLGNQHFDQTNWDLDQSDRIGLSLLKQLGLIEYQNIQLGLLHGWFDVQAAWITELGAEFLFATQPPELRLMPNERPAGEYFDTDAIPITEIYDIEKLKAELGDR